MVQNSAAREVERPKKTCSNIIFSSEVGGGGNEGKEAETGNCHIQLESMDAEIVPQRASRI